MANWGEKLKIARKSQKITQQELAEYLGVHRSTIANYEMERRKPTFMELKRIAEKLHVDLNYLAEGTEVSADSDLILRAKAVFADTAIPESDRDAIFQDIMKIYIDGKGK